MRRRQRLDPDGWQSVVVVVPSARVMLWMIDIHVQTVAVASSHINQTGVVIVRALTTAPGQPTNALSVSSPPLLHTIEIAFTRFCFGMKGAAFGKVLERLGTALREHTLIRFVRRRAMIADRDVFGGLHHFLNIVSGHQLANLPFVPRGAIKCFQPRAWVL